MFKVHKILLCAGLERQVISIYCKIHKFDFAVEGDSYIMQGEVSMSNSHVVEKGIDP